MISYTTETEKMEGRRGGGWGGGVRADEKVRFKGCREKKMGVEGMTSLQVAPCSGCSTLIPSVKLRIPPPLPLLPPEPSAGQNSMHA